MKKPAKAALLSAMVFPGAGHFFLKKHIPGVVLAGTALVALSVVVTKTVERALQITAKIQSGEVPLDAATVAELVSRQPAGSVTQSLNIATAIFLTAWLFGIADSYRVGRVQDRGGRID